MQDLAFAKSKQSISANLKLKANLNSYNAKPALKELLRIVESSGFGRENIIVESGDFVALKAFSDSQIKVILVGEKGAWR